MQNYKMKGVSLKLTVQYWNINSVGTVNIVTAEVAKLRYSTIMKYQWLVYLAYRYKISE